MSRWDEEQPSLEEEADLISHRIEERWDTRMIDFMFREMTGKMRANREKGRSGWWAKDRCDNDFLGEMLFEHLQKGQYLDVAILASMIHFRDHHEKEGQ